jgi:hypothetical protein
MRIWNVARVAQHFRRNGHVCLRRLPGELEEAKGAAALVQLLEQELQLRGLWRLVQPVHVQQPHFVRPTRCVALASLAFLFHISLTSVVMKQFFRRCISEAEKYQGKLYKGPKSNQQKQQTGKNNNSSNENNVNSKSSSLASTAAAGAGAGASSSSSSSSSNSSADSNDKKRKRETYEKDSSEEKGSAESAVATEEEAKSSGLGSVIESALAKKEGGSMAFKKLYKKIMKKAPEESAQAILDALCASPNLLVSTSSS